MCLFRGMTEEVNTSLPVYPRAHGGSIFEESRNLTSFNNSFTKMLLLY